MLTSLTTLLRRHGLLELRLLIRLGLIATGLLLFLQIGDRLGTEPHALDRALLLGLRSAGDPADPIGPVWFEELVRDVTALGSTGVLAFITLAVACFLAFNRSLGDALLLVVSVGGGMLLSNLLKSGYDRPRPDLVPHATDVVTASFPSGHAMVSAVTYLTLGALLARGQASRRLRAYILGQAILLTLLIGSSRIYLGVHWPSDVLGGWVIGACWASLCWLVARWAQERRMIEPPAG